MLVQATSTGRHHLDVGEHRHWRGNGHAVAEDAGFEPDALWELTPQQHQIVRLASP